MCGASRLNTTLTLALVMLLGACGEGSAPPQSAAQVRLYEQLRRPASLRASGDTAFVVTKVENRQRELTAAQREDEARAVASVVKQEWPDPRLTSVIVVLQRHTRLGPISLRVREHRLRVDLQTGEVTEPPTPGDAGQPR